MNEEERLCLLRIIRRAGEKLPELRLGQLPTNAAGSMDLFYIPDDVLAERLIDLITSGEFKA